MLSPASVVRPDSLDSPASVLAPESAVVEVGVLGSPLLASLAALPLPEWLALSLA